VGVDVLDASWIERVWLASRAMGPIDLLALPLGAVREDDDPTLPFPKTEQLVHVNFIAITQCVQRFWQELEERRGVAIGFGSIAASRGRGRNAAYAAAKRALQSWFESLRHFAIGRGVRVQFYIPGYLRTSLAYGMGLRLPLAEPLAFAEIVIRDVGLDFGVRYYPFYWGYICAVIRLLPWNFFKRLRF
jgi:short-subunit dehydrogenase